MLCQFGLCRLRGLLIGCAAGLVVALVALLVNLELAIRVFLPGWRAAERMLTANWFAWLSPLGADLSVVSTAVPVLLFAFPLWHGWRRLQDLRHDPSSVSHVVDPYPEHFPFFCIMLGLYGTLYGMMVGLSSSGISGLAASAPTSEGIRNALDRLLSGTATALLSSIVGMIGAFLAAKPLPALYRWCAHTREEAADDDLIASIGQVTTELQAMARAGTEARQSWGNDPVGQIVARLEKMQTVIEASAGTAARLQESMEVLVRSQARLEEGLLEGSKAIQQSTAQVAVAVDTLALHEPDHREALLQISKCGQAATDQMRQMAGELSTQHQAVLAEWKAMRDLAARQTDEASRDRTALRRAFASYAEDADAR